MACYFDEHNCKPLGEGETPDQMLHLARLLLDSGLGVEFDMTFNRMFANERPPPPASKKAVAELRSRIIRGEVVPPLPFFTEGSCAVCLKAFDQDDELKELPCRHEFHSSCILPWLGKTNSCPVCRFELPTDDQDYEDYKKQKKRAKEQAETLENLHNSMFG